MPRGPLTETSANTRRGVELTPYTRAKITTLHEEGAEIRHIADRLQISENTIKYTIKSDSQRSKGNTVQRKGRPKNYTERDQRSIIRFVRIHPKSTYRDIQQNLHVYLSHDTLGRILDSVGIKNWRAKGRPALDPEDAKKR
jgi:transposase